MTLWQKLNVILLYEDGYRNNVVIKGNTYHYENNTRREIPSKVFCDVGYDQASLYHKDEIQDRKHPNRGGNLKSLIRFTSDLYQAIQFPQFTKGYTRSNQFQTCCSR